MKKVVCFLLAVVMMFGMVGCGGTTEATPAEATQTAEPNLDFLDDFTKYGYDAGQIAYMKKVLNNVGIMEVLNPQIGNVLNGVQTVEGLAYKNKSDEVQVRFNIENGGIYYIHIYCPTNFLSGLSDRRAELYYDAEGGYLKRIDWDRETVVDFWRSIKK